MKEDSKWSQIKDKIKEDPRYKTLKSSKLRERLFEEFIMEEVLVTPGQKRQRMIE